MSRITTCERGIHFRELSPKEGKCRYRFQTIQHVRFRMEGLVDEREVISFRDATGDQWMQIDRFGILISEGYAWNGSSPKRWVPILGWVGTPDFECTIPASLVHDALYQFHACQHMPMHRSEVDALFYDVMIALRIT